MGTKLSTCICKQYGILKKTRYSLRNVNFFCQAGFRKHIKIGRAVNSIPPRTVEGKTKLGYI
jgi:hypothetical protein